MSVLPARESSLAARLLEWLCERGMSDTGKDGNFPVIHQNGESDAPFHGRTLTFAEYLEKFPEKLQALKDGKESLFLIVNGHSHWKGYSVKKTDEGGIEIIRTDNMYRPSEENRRFEQRLVKALRKKLNLPAETHIPIRQNTYFNRNPAGSCCGHVTAIQRFVDGATYSPSEREEVLSALDRHLHTSNGLQSDTFSQAWRRLHASNTALHNSYSHRPEALQAGRKALEQELLEFARRGPESGFLLPPGHKGDFSEPEPYISPRMAAPARFAVMQREAATERDMLRNNPVYAECHRFMTPAEREDAVSRETTRRVQEERERNRAEAVCKQLVGGTATWLCISDNVRKDWIDDAVKLERNRKTAKNMLRDGLGADWYGLSSKNQEKLIYAAVTETQAQQQTPPQSPAHTPPRPQRAPGSNTARRAQQPSGQPQSARQPQAVSGAAPAARFYTTVYPTVKRRLEQTFGDEWQSFSQRDRNRLAIGAMNSLIEESQRSCADILGAGGAPVNPEQLNALVLGTLQEQARSENNAAETQNRSFSNGGETPQRQTSPRSRAYTPASPPQRAPAIQMQAAPIVPRRTDSSRPHAETEGNISGALETLAAIRLNSCGIAGNALSAGLLRDASDNIRKSTALKCARILEDNNALAGKTPEEQTILSNNLILGTLREQIRNEQRQAPAAAPTGSYARRLQTQRCAAGNPLHTVHQPSAVSCR